MPEKTLGVVATAAQQMFDDLQSVGVDLTEVFFVSENERVEKLQQSWTQLLAETRTQLSPAAE
ncbi:hypothetical protein [Candidatus Mycobacterium methanotrophicum]|uniref:Luciferase-like domain-containing protein n=1 Tax=Candidatus Mycobacterium methanotrophicum TaxID=2943498 RepID=A0ABY4QS80_9MYCO|nr:hypothetical protein [Candidatus Mycobacterium methanotrophicum]UQX12430.1 hypothetical protein M5I08_09390 [Candidatus Mycobacterium methanotrophicum]